MFWNRISGIYDFVENTFNGKVNRDIAVVDKLGEKGVAMDAIEQYVNTLNDCEFERYAPSGLARPLQDMYTRAAEAIEQMENNIKN